MDETGNEGTGIISGAPAATESTAPVQNNPIEPIEPAAQTNNEQTPAAPQLHDGQWFIREGILGDGDRPAYLLEKYGYNQENQAKAYPDAAKKIGEQNQRLGAFTGAPDKYDFSTIEDDGFQFDTQDETFNQFVTECQNNNVSQDFALKVAGFAKGIMQQPETNMANEIKSYGENFKTDKTNIENWTKNNNSEADAKELLGSIKSAGAVRALRNLMNTNGVNVPTQETTAIPQESLNDAKTNFAANLYGGDNLAANPEKVQKYVDSFNKFHK